MKKQVQIAIVASLISLVWPAIGWWYLYSIGKLSFLTFAYVGLSGSFLGRLISRWLMASGWNRSVGRQPGQIHYNMWDPNARSYVKSVEEAQNAKGAS